MPSLPHADLSNDTIPMIVAEADHLDHARDHAMASEGRLHEDVEAAASVPGSRDDPHTLAFVKQSGCSGLAETVAAAPGSLVELDPSSLIPSPFSTREDEPENCPSFLQLFDSIRKSGQQVPILVTPYGDGLVCVYGHRRVRVAMALEQTVTALVGELDWLDAIVAQGLENAAKLELTFIEKARFAFRLHREGVEPAQIAQAMAVDVTTVSRFLKITRAFDAFLLRSIGRAPKAGRPRWTEVADALSEGTGKLRALRAAYRVVEDDGFAALTSDQRFERVRSAVLGKVETSAVKRVVFSADGRLIARVSMRDDGSCMIKLVGDCEAFAATLVDALPTLFAAVEAHSTLQEEFVAPLLAVDRAQAA